MSKHPETATLAEFARLANRKRSYITELKAAGRLVMTEDGKRVVVADSLAMIEATRDPSKAGVAARHAAAREVGQGEGAAPMPAAAPGATGDATDADVDEVADAATTGYQDARAMRERYLAKAAKRDYLVSIGKLLSVDEVTAAVAAAAATLRTRFEGLPDVLGPQLAAAQDESAARAILAEAIEHALEEASRQFAAIGRQVAA